MSGDLAIPSQDGMAFSILERSPEEMNGGGEEQVDTPDFSLTMCIHRYIGEQ